MTTKKVLVPLAQGCEELEAVTVIDLLVRAGIDVVTASLDSQLTITASRGVKLIAQTELSQVEDIEFDLIVLPGGMPGSDYLNDCVLLHTMLQKAVQSGRSVAAICAAPKVLAKAGLLDHKKATSFPGAVDQNATKGMVYVDQPVVIDGQIITSKGPGTAIIFALTLIEILLGQTARQKVESGLQIP